MKFSQIAAMLLLSVSTLLAGSEVNLMPNAALNSKDGFLPDGWNGLRGTESRKAYKTENGVLRITGKTANYVSYSGVTIDVEPGKSYYWSFEMKSDQLSNHAAFYYSVQDANRKVLVNARPLVTRYTGPQNDWVKVGFIIPLSSLPAAKKLSLSIAVYNPSRKVLAEDKAIYLRNFHLTYYNGQKNILPPKPQSNFQGAVMPDQPFARHNFIGSALGKSYLLEKNGVGFFRMDSGTMPRQTVTMQIKHPKGVQTELYMWKRGSRECTRIPGNNGRYVIGREYDWLIWSNCLIFTADKSVPDEFNMELAFECGGKKIAFTVPVQQIAEFPGGKLPEKLRFNSWQSFPVTRINTADPANKLAAQLENYWKRSGWVHTPFVEICNVIPARLRANVSPLPLRQAVDPAGTPVPLYCNTAVIAAGADFFCRYLKQKKFADRIANTEYVKWDYEPYNQGPVTISCFCKECIAEFARRNNLPATVSCTEILQKHKRAWVDFRCRQRAEVVRTVVGGIKKINPAVKFELCTMPFAPGNDEEYETAYGIRSSLYTDFIDLFTSMNYSGTLNFYRSIEREALELAKEKRTLLNSGWTAPNSGKRLAHHLLAAFFCGEKYPYIAQGLFISNGEQLRELRKVMDFTARTESRWSRGKLLRNQHPVTRGFNAADNLYILERRSDNGESWLLLFNNSDRDAVFARLSAPGSITDLGSGDVLGGAGEVITLKIAPLAYQLLEISTRKKAATVKNDYAREEQDLIKAAQQKVISERRNGISYSITPGKWVVTTPIHSMQFDPRNSGEAAWYVKGKLAAHTIGRDIFMDRGVFDLNKNNVTLENVKINSDAVKIRFACQLKEKPYDGLIIRREYTLLRNEPVIKAAIEIVPQGGYRNFRLRTVNNFAMPLQANPNAPVSVIAMGKVSDQNLFHIGFVRQGAKFPDNKPFFAGKYMKKQYPLTNNKVTASPVNGKLSFELTSQNADQIFVWRARNAASLEIIWPDAYPHYDPHLIATWKNAYELKVIEK